MQGRAYTATLDAAGTTAAFDLIEILAPSDGVVVIDKVSVSQETATASAAGAVQIHFSTSTGSTGAAITATPVDAGDAAFGGTVTGLTTGAASTEAAIIYREGWNVLAPWIWHPTPEERAVVTPSEGVTVRLDTYPGSTMAVSAVVSFREIGG